ncbi:MAG: DUF3352 domain-containing protein [Leptolyngbyaceae cyanobacterium bins.349]|nr:DUF3352 domain-containing protein [Leptolyngbyaceae cyanobacterium bins.349]
MKLRSFFTGLMALVVVLLLIGAGGFYWITANSPLKLLASGAGKQPSAAIFVSRQAPAMVSLLVNPEDIKAFRQVVAAPSQRRQARAELAQFEQSLLTDTGLNYERDVQPWLGDEVTLAITTLDIDRDATNGKQPGYLLALATQDPERSREFLQVFWQKRAIAGTDLTFEQYKGVKLIYNEVPLQQLESSKQATGKRQKAASPSPAANLPPRAFSLLPTPALASAVVGDQFVLFANDPRVLRNAITNVQAAELNLNRAAVYTQALDTLTQPRVGLAFINLPGLAGWLETESITPAKSSETKPEPTPQTASSHQSLAIALELTRTGLMAETAMIGADRKAAIAPMLNQPVAALNYIPSTSPVAASGTNLTQLWRELAVSLAHYGPVSALVDQSLQNLGQQWNLDLPQDIFSWVTGEYALANLSAVPAAAPPSTQQTRRRGRKQTAQWLNQANDWIFVAERGTGNAATAAIAHLDDIAKQQGYSVGTVQLGEQAVSAWTKLTSRDPYAKTLAAEVQGVHTTVGNYELFATSLAAMEQALHSKETPLTQDDRFQQAIAPMQHPNNGYLYLDWAESRPLLTQRFPWLNVIELAGTPLLNHLQSFTISSYGRQNGIQRGAVFLRLS